MVIALNARMWWMAPNPEYKIFSWNPCLIAGCLLLGVVGVPGWSGLFCDGNQVSFLELLSFDACSSTFGLSTK